MNPSTDRFSEDSGTDMEWPTTENSQNVTNEFTITGAARRYHLFDRLFQGTL